MKNVRMLAVALTLAWVNSYAFNPSIDLQGGEAIAEGQCPIDNMIYKCFIVKKDENLFIVVVDEAGPLAVFSVKEIKQDYSEDEVTKVWTRHISNRRRYDT